MADVKLGRRIGIIEQFESVRSFAVAGDTSELCGNIGLDIRIVLVILMNRDQTVFIL